MENSIEETKKQLELILKVRKEQKEIIECAGGSCMNCDPDIKALTESIEILSDYKRVLKENEKLKQEKINNYKMIALAQNEALGYMQGYEDGKKLKTSAIASILENQQYYIIQKQMEKYEEHIAKLQKENEELKLKNKTLKELATTYQGNCISVQKVKDKMEKDIKTNEHTILGGRRNGKTLEYGKRLGRIEMCQELLEGRK